MLDNEVVVRNVETDLKIGWVNYYTRRDPRDPHRVEFCVEVKDDRGKLMGYGFEPQLPPEIVACCEEQSGYPHFKRRIDKAPACNRVERRLGKMIADLTGHLLQVLTEGASDGVTLETKQNSYLLFKDLLDFWEGSRFGSWNAERRVYEPYFADPKPENPRLNFGGAVRAYGLIELRKRFPQEPEDTLRKLLCGLIDMMDLAIKAMSAQPSPKVLALAAEALRRIREGVNRLPILTPYRLPILTPLSGGV